MKLLLFLAFIASATAQFGNFGLPKVNIPSNPATGITDSIENLLPEEWLSFKNSFNKSYTSLGEEVLRKGIYLQNRQAVELFNKLYNTGKKTFEQQLNLFADLRLDEFNKFLNGFKGNLAKRTNAPKPTSILTANVEEQLPENVDWREKGAVSPVKYQGLCACCYAFSAAGAIEGHNFLKNGQLVELSPQNIMDCSNVQGNTGCDGGYIDTSFQYVQENKGLNPLSAYPFESKVDKCRLNEQEKAAGCQGFVEIPSGDEQALKVAVAKYGPVAAAIDAGQQSFQYYSKGIYYDEKCHNKLEDLNHAVLVVGYGVEPDGQKYWLVKNSYSSKWGIDGYVKIAREKNNHCGIATQALYPLV